MNQESILPINWAPYSNDVTATRKTNHVFKELDISRHRWLMLIMYQAFSSVNTLFQVFSLSSLIFKERGNFLPCMFYIVPDRDEYTRAFRKCNRVGQIILNFLNGGKYKRTRTG